MRIFKSKLINLYSSQVVKVIWKGIRSFTHRQKRKEFKNKGVFFIPNNGLLIQESAFHRLTRKQKHYFVILLEIIIIGLLFNWHATLTIIIALLTLVYLSDLLFNLFIICRSFSHPPEITISNEEINNIPENSWPTYTVLCPLYRESKILLQFISAMKALEYPKEKLQVLLILEGDDNQTLDKARKLDLPDFMKIITVPQNHPRTKPKALNYGLRFATGEYVTIYDAEDIPEPNQLKKAVIALNSNRDKLACVQAKLNFYNPHQNILTRVFTAEYALWFDLVLTGLQSLNAPIPLGGTSNHFKKSVLKSLHGWDSYNVTEDCDLGMRLYKAGYYTAVIDSVTLEEANSTFFNWFRQRSRWVKGYMQTYLVHLRSMKEFISNKGLPHVLIFHLVVGGKVMSMLINPLMWLLTVVYFVFRSRLGGFIESFYSVPILYMAAFSLVFGNFLYLYYYMIGCAKRDQQEIIKYVYLVPFYWLGMSMSAWWAIYQIVRFPYHWAKTHHGLHLGTTDKKKRSLYGQIVVNISIPISTWSNKFRILNIFKPKKIKLFSALILTGLSTFLYLTLDLILLDHLVGPFMSGNYVLLSQAGKMIFIIGSIPNIFIIPYFKKSKQSYSKLFRFSLCLILIVYIFVGTLGDIFLPQILGERIVYISPYLAKYGVAVSLFTLANSLTLYHLAKGQNIYSFFALLYPLFIAVGIYANHSNLNNIVSIVTVVSFIYFIVVFAFHILGKNGKFVLKNFIDLVNAFFPIRTTVTVYGGKRVLIFNWRDTKHKYAGGAEVYIHELARRWVASGHHVTLFCGNDGRSPKYEVVDGVQVYRRGGFYFVYVWAFLYYLLHFRGKYDVVIDSQNGIPFFTPFYVKEPVYSLMHHVHQEVFRKSLSRPLAILASFLENRLMPWVYRKSKFITVSFSTKAEMERLGITGSSIEVVYPGVDLSVLQPGEKFDRPLVTYLGRLKYYKSLDIFIEAAAKVTSTNPKVQFIIAGEGEEKKKLQKLVRNLNMEDNINFLGKVSQKEKVYLYQKSWVFVNPSMMEGWGITTIEANACGTPVIAADVPGLRESVRNPSSGYTVPYGDSQAFAQKILLLLEDDILRDRMSKMAVDWARNFDWDKSAYQSLEILK